MVKTGIFRRTLVSLNLNATKVTAAGVKGLQKALPKLEISSPDCAPWDKFYLQYP